jgi:hypothetical protein
VRSGWYDQSGGAAAGASILWTITCPACGFSPLQRGFSFQNAASNQVRQLRRLVCEVKNDRRSRLSDSHISKTDSNTGT